LFAANGYVVIETNYRGSNGRGEVYEKAIIGLADTARLGIGGWSYGGILTDYTIASDHRFKAATSGAGVDQSVVSVLPCEPDYDPDAIPRGRSGLQRASDWRRADVPGAEITQRASR
jgi:hypothetical protein